MRLLEVLQRSATFLDDRGVDSPRLQAEWILAHVLSRPRLQLYLEFDRELSEGELAAARDMVARRGRRVPLQHLVGSTSFCGLELEVSSAALIPRPETELLAERAWDWLRARREGGAHGPPAILDWGTGSGCLAIALAVRERDARITALDVSGEALELARRNATRHGCEERIEFVEGDGCAALASEKVFDLVMSNPPYIPTPDWEGLQPEVRDHDPRRALDGGWDGLDVYRRLAVELPARCGPGAVVLLEFGDGQAARLGELLGASGWIVAEVHRDYSGRERFLLARRAG